VRGLLSRVLEDERVRFLIVGGINTVVGYGVFALFELFLGRYIGYLGSLYSSYALATMLAFYLHRRFTFRASTSGKVVVDFLRFQSVYVVSLLVNTAALLLLVVLFGLKPLVAQAIIVVITTAISYLGHKWFSFRRKAQTSAL
jgi:putative flippase GtrA